MRTATNIPMTSNAKTVLPRTIIHSTKGDSGGFITRLMSPSDRRADLIKPFVFLDRFEGDFTSAPPIETGWHPHSGIATVTVVLDGSVRYAETTGQSGVLPAGSIEWMRAGGGVWHTGSPNPGVIAGFQLWVALPPELENAHSESQYILPDQVPSHGPARVIVGRYGNAASPIVAPKLTYLSVSLKDGERWTFEPPPGHDVAWVALMNGALRTPALITQGQLAIFEQAETSIHFVAEGDTRFVLGSAPQHPHELCLGSYSVHTSHEALARGEAEVRRIGRTLREEGKQSRALWMFS
ncbi:MAG: pirin family protein [Polyangia bacterium]